MHETQDKRMRQLRQQLSQALEQQSKHSIGYYDFLLVAKKLDFRFELSDDLMALRKHFFKHKNQLPINRFVASLIVAQ